MPMLLLVVVYTVTVLVSHSQAAQSGFTSLDCGLVPENSKYREETTEIDYISDAPFISSGESRSISSEYKVNRPQQDKTVRSFPEGIRNCYNVSTGKGTKYLIRATFLYGNYDGMNVTPQFDLHLGANLWDTVKIVDSSSNVVKEIILLALRSYVRVCLVNTGNGTPFISALELRDLKHSTYELQSGMSLDLVVRLDVGSTSNLTYRYPLDVFDRLWSAVVPFPTNGWAVLTTPMTVDLESHIDFQPPQDVMSTAATPVNESAPLQFTLEAADRNTGYFLYMHVAELRELKANESRAFNIKVNGRLLYGPVEPTYLYTATIYSHLVAVTGGLNYSFTLESIENSTLPPILNAIEVYSLLDLSQPETHEDDANAMINIKSMYGVKRNWDGDPCVPVKYLWTGLNCSNDGYNPPRIISLDLSSSGLTGKITTYIAGLRMLESLDLSNNSLTGSVPRFLSQLQSLRVLNLGKNKFAGLVPAEIIARSDDGSLSLRVEGNQYLCGLSGCKKKKTNRIIIPTASSVGGCLLVLFIAATVFLGAKNHKRKQVLGKVESNNEKDSFEFKKRQFTYAQIKMITNNFERVLGKGGFGTVYHGIVDDGTQVAVKMIFLPPSNKGSQTQSQEEEKRKREHAEQRYQQFQAEVKLLMTVYHGNLTSLVGYCKQGTNMALIYEYMANGDLESHLKVKQGIVLSWETRLQIATDAAQGLDYLHNSCKPPIIHRDVKPANILLTDKFRAKLADFGLSKFFPTEDGTHVSTVHIAGTPGYLDPDLTNNSWINDKSDVFSFGVVLLQIITCRPAILSRSDGEGSIVKTHISQWVSSMLDSGNVESIADAKLEGNFDITSLWKAVQIAMACVSSTAIGRPNMTKVVNDLRECLALEQDRKNYSLVVADPIDSNHDGAL